jgi:hypothetical protein
MVQPLSMSLLLWVLASFVLASPARATMIVEFDGVITSSFVFTDPFGFGTGSGVLNGRAIRGSFFYDPALAPPDSDVDARQVFHRTLSGSGAWFSTPEVYIDGVLVPVPPFDLFSGFLQTDSALIQLSDETSTGFDVVGYSREFFQYFDDSNIHSFDLKIAIDSSATGQNLIDDLLLTTPFEISNFAGLNQGGTSISSRRTDGGVTAYDFFAAFQLTPTTLRVTAVPEPPTLALLAVAWAGAGSVWRSRASRSGIAAQQSTPG